MPSHDGCFLGVYVFFLFVLIFLLRMRVIILCGGLSTRLGDITKNIPKNLLEIKGKTVLDRQLEKLKDLGVDRVMLAAGHLSEELKKFVGNTRLGMAIDYVVEEKKLGTGGAIKYAWSHFENNNEPVLVYNGDVLLNADLKKFSKNLRAESEGIILSAKVDDVSAYGTLEFNQENRLLQFIEKTGKQESGYINGGVYIFNQRIWELFPSQDNFSIEYDVFPKINDFDVYLDDGPWVDIGEPDRLNWARQYWSD